MISWDGFTALWPGNIDAELAGRLGPAFATRLQPKGCFLLKGKEQEVEIFEVHREPVEALAVEVEGLRDRAKL